LANALKWRVFVYTSAELGFTGALPRIRFGEFMKKTYLRTGVAALACALGLSACGGSGGELVLGGNISGLTKESVVLQNNGAHDYAVTPMMLGANGAFYFPETVGVDEQYHVTVKSWPSNVDHCDVTNGVGRSAFNVTNIFVNCFLKTHSLGGTVSGLAAGSLVLVNGNDKTEVTAGSGTFTMPAKVGEDIPYGVSILSAPANLSCTVANGTGTMGKTDIANVAVSCVAKSGT
jgi:hypothetical protein